MVMTDLNDLKLQPFNLSNVPSDLEGCIYPEERKRGEVFCPETIYRVVLALRWMLTYTDSGLEEEFEAWKVYWKNDDEYGFKTHIFLFCEKVEQFDSWDGKYTVLQKQTLCELAMLQCRDGRGLITDVHMSIGYPFEGMKHFYGVYGVQRLLENAAIASRGTHHEYSLTHHADSTSVYRSEGGEGVIGDSQLIFKLECEHSRVKAIDLKVGQGVW